VCSSDLHGSTFKREEQRILAPLSLLEDGRLARPAERGRPASI
jgi:hypothetical protein